MTSVAATLALGGCTIDPATARLIDQLFPGVDHDEVAKAASEAVANLLQRPPTTVDPVGGTPTDDVPASEADDPVTTTTTVADGDSTTPTDDVEPPAAASEAAPASEPSESTQTTEAPATTETTTAAAAAETTSEAQPAVDDGVSGESAEPDRSEVSDESDESDDADDDADGAADGADDGEPCDDEAAGAVAPGQTVREWAQTRGRGHGVRDRSVPSPSWQPPVTTQPAPAPTPPPTTTPPTTTPVADADLGVMATQFLDLINGERAAVGLAPLSASAALNNPALVQAMAIEARDDLFHQDLRPLLNLGFRTAGENVGYGPDVQTLHDAFVASPGHYANIVNEAFTSIGIGVVIDERGTIWVAMVFGG